MFATENEYTEAVRGSQIHSYENEAQKRTTIINVMVATTLMVSGYFGFNYYQESHPSLAEATPIAKQAVLGVSHTASLPSTIQPSAEPSTSNTEVVEEQDDYLAALENMEVDDLSMTPSTPKSTPQVVSQLDIGEAMNSLVEGSGEKSSDYAQDISKELHKDKISQKRTVVVKKGDTLASLSAKYYGSEMNFHKIVSSNSKISGDSGTIYVGQEIVLPY